MSEQLRLSAQKAFDRVGRAELAMEEDPRFLAWIEQWIAGEMAMPEVRDRYIGLLRERATELRQRALARVPNFPFDPGPEPAVVEETDSFLSEIAKE
ncbi:hypothetical protein LJR245_007322 [Rhizobium leguminosarum]|nr:hypothetical protein [Rhizobium leguminosarum]